MDTINNLPKHIPDEWIVVWKEKSLEELMAKAERLQEHIMTIQSEDSKKAMQEILDALESYIESIILKRDIDLDVML